MAEYHPVTVHFPIVLLLLWPILDGLGLWLKKEDLCYVATGLLALALVSALIATITGQAAFDLALAEGYDPALLEKHTLDADIVPWLVLVVALVRSAGVHKFGKKAHALAILMGFCVSGFLLSVAHEGGDLVYAHGVGVQKDEVEPK